MPIATKMEGMTVIVQIPEKIEVDIDSKILIIKGPKGENRRDISDPRLDISKKEGKILVSTKKASKRDKKLVNSYCAHIRNMIKGSLDSHRYVLKICSSHFPMNVSATKNELTIKNFIGEKYPRKLSFKEGVEVKVEEDKITIVSCNKEVAGTTASDIEKLTKRANFDSRIFQDGIYIINKDDKGLK